MARVRRSVASSMPRRALLMAAASTSLAALAGVVSRHGLDAPLWLRLPLPLELRRSNSCHGAGWGNRGGVGITARAAEVNPADCKGVRNEAIDGVQLPAMDEDEPAWLAFVIARYLDEEWIEQPVHEEIGAAVGRIYGESRAAGDNDLIAVLAKLTY